jgi:hypothetical protein
MCGAIIHRTHSEGVVLHHVWVCVWVCMIMYDMVGYAGKGPASVTAESSAKAVEDFQGIVDELKETIEALRIEIAQTAQTCVQFEFKDRNYIDFLIF